MKQSRFSAKFSFLELFLEFNIKPRFPTATRFVLDQCAEQVGTLNCLVGVERAWEQQTLTVYVNNGLRDLLFPG